MSKLDVLGFFGVPYIWRKSLENDYPPFNSMGPKVKFGPKDIQDLNDVLLSLARTELTSLALLWMLPFDEITSYFFLWCVEAEAGKGAGAGAAK